MGKWEQELLPNMSTAASDAPNKDVACAGYGHHISYRPSSCLTVWNLYFFNSGSDGASLWVCVPKKPNTPALIAEWEIGWGQNKAICKCELSDNSRESRAINQNVPLIIISEKRWLLGVCRTPRPCRRFFSPPVTKPRQCTVSSPEESAEKNINSGAQKAECKHFRMLIIDNKRANVKAIYLSYMGTWGKKEEVALLFIWLWGARASVSPAQQQ